MKSYELVAKTIKGENPGRTPVYGWVRANLTPQITEAFGSVEAFEDHYEFDMSHVFGGPAPFIPETYRLRDEGTEITPEVLLDLGLSDPDEAACYESVKSDLAFYKGQRERFCYMQTTGCFEGHNDPFGIENHLMYLALYPDEVMELYSRLAQWNKRFISNCLDLGIDMIHISDDWGAQNSLMFSPSMYREMIKPYHMELSEFVKSRGAFFSLHSDGCIRDVLDDIVDIGYDVIHPYQEMAGMSYDTYLEKHSDKFTILGGVCIQSTLGFGKLDFLQSEIERVFSLLKGKRWLCCTTHYVQDHCSVEELTFAYDLIAKLRK